MRRTLAILCLLAGIAAAPFTARAQGLDPAQEPFVEAFLSFRKAEELESAGDLAGAMKGFKSAADTLARLSKTAPTWQPELVEYRKKRSTEAIARVQGKMGGPAPVEPKPAGNPDLGLPPIDTTDPLDPPVASPVKTTKPGPKKPPIAIKPTGDPIEDLRNRMNALESQLNDANSQLAAEQQKNTELSNELTGALGERKKAEMERKKAQDLAEVYQKSLLELKTKGDTSSDKAKELETQLAAAKKKNVETDAELTAAEERLTQLVERSRAVSAKAAEAGAMPAQIKDLQAKLDAESKAKAELSGKLANITKERDDAKTEVARLQQLNAKADKLMADNAQLLTKLGDAEKQILAFRTDGKTKDTDIAALKKQVTDAQAALASTTEKNTALTMEIGTLQKKVADYTKEIQQVKKSVSVEERRKMEEENKLLQGIVMRVLQEDANRAQRKRMVQKELDKLQGDSSALLKQIDYLTQPVVKLSNAERRLFKNPVVNVQDLNTLVIVKPAEPGAEPAPSPTEPAPADAPPAEAPKPAAPTGDLPAPDPEKPAAKPPVETVKLDKPPKEMPPEPVEPGPSVATNTTPRVLPEEVKPLAEQAKAAFERDKYPEAEKLYDRALSAAPNNLYLLSNKAVVQFRAGKFKQAEETFRKALAIAPEDHFSWGTLGIVQYSQGKYDEAVNSLTKSLAINPKNATAHNYLGITAAQKGWLEAAEKELLTAIQLDAKYADAWFNLAVTHTMHTPPRKEEARKAYIKAKELGADADPALDQLMQ